MRRHRQAGQSIAEFALMLPFLLLILLGCLDLGRVFSVWMILTNASREGARYACLFPDDVPNIVARTQDDIRAEGLSLSADVLRIDVATPSGKAGGSPVAVTVRYTLPLTTSFLFGGQPLTIRAGTQMMIVDGGS